MTPTIEGPSTRTYHIRFTDGATVEIRAITICTPDSNSSYYTLKRDDGAIVAQFRSNDVSGWHITELVGRNS